MHPVLRDIQAQVSIDLVLCGLQADVQGFFNQQHRVLGGLNAVLIVSMSQIVL